MLSGMNTSNGKIVVFRLNTIVHLDYNIAVHQMLLLQYLASYCKTLQYLLPVCG